MVEQRGATDEICGNPAAAVAPSTSTRLPLLVFHHRRNPGEDEDDGNDDHPPTNDDMLMFSVSKQSLHKNMEHESA
ncbi:hypothetical protein ACP70R_020296 [Stipagrostis hirtigluma subsp. patula]